MRDGGDEGRQIVAVIFLGLSLLVTLVDRWVRSNRIGVEESVVGMNWQGAGAVWSVYTSVGGSSNETRGTEVGVVIH